MAKDKKNDFASNLMDAVKEGTKRWTSQRKSEERNPASRQYRSQRMMRKVSVKVKDAAWEVMEEAYMKASGNGEYPANARQIMYAARPHIQGKTQRKPLDNYFTQTLLPNYMEENAVDWDVAYDARGHFAEPHDQGEKCFGIGTIEVRNYLAGFRDPTVVEAGFSEAKVKTSGPAGNFGAVLFIEKEGFDPVFKSARIAERFDIAVMSTKGMSVVAARTLVDEMCSDHDIPLLLLHDFDKSGFSIAGTLRRDTRRYEFQNSITVVDLGLSLEDVEAMGLESEYQHHPKGQRCALEENLRTNGAREEEIAFMFRDFDRLRSTRRVELNAMTSPQFVAFVERKLRENGVAKVVPDQDLLAEVFVGMERGRRMEEAVEQIEEIDMEDCKPPKDLEKRVRNILKKRPAMRWDAAVAEIVTRAGRRKAKPPIDLGTRTASVPFMMTQRMKADLAALGFSAEEIRDMTPIQAREILDGKPAAPATEVPK
jgi:hypothetical protein